MELFKVPPRWLFLKLTTDDGIVGWGEPIVEGKADAVRACVEELKDQLIGREAGNIEELWQTMYRCNFYRGGPVLTSAMSGIEQALWDVKGKALGVPVYELLGGAVRDRLRMYAWIMAEGDADYLSETQQRIDQGYDTIKMCVTDELGWVDNVRKVHAAAEKVARIRERFGYDIDIAVDFHGRVHMPMARMLIKELEPYGLLYIEEPLQPEQIEGFRELRRHTSTPLATGERMYTRWGFKNLIASGAIDADAAASMTEKIEGYRALLAASSEMDSSTSLDADVDAQIEVAYTGETSEDMSMAMTGSMQVVLDESDMQMAYTFDIDAMGETMTMGEWMRDGWVYVQMETGGETVQTKTQVNTEEMQALLAQVQAASSMASPANSADGLAMVDSITVSTSGSNTVYTLVIGQNSMSSILDTVLGMLGTTDAAGVDMSLVQALLDTLDFSDITAIYTVGSDGQVEEMAIQFSMTLDGTALGAPEESLTMAFDMDVAINALGDAVRVDFPAGLEDFPELPELPDELPADVETSGEGTVPSASDSSESMDLSAEETAGTIYVTKTGKRYHYDSTCNGGTYYPSTLEEALSRGLTPCEKCVLH